MSARKQRRVIYSPTREEPKRRSQPPPSIVLAILQLALTIGVIVGLLYAFLFLWQATSPKETVVPRIEGLTQTAAEVLLKHAGFDSQIASTRQSESLEAGKVIEAQPAPGRHIKEGRKIDLIISSGSAWTQVPDIRGMSIRRAEPLLQQSSLAFGKQRYIFYTQLPKGFVIDQLPEPGTRVKINSGVQVLISQGPRPTPEATNPEPSPEGGATPTPTPPPTNEPAPDGFGSGNGL